MNRLSKRGLLPQCISKIKKAPLCAACIFSHQHIRRIHPKGDFKPICSDNIKPGGEISCDHLISKQGGLMSQVTEILIHARYNGATICVDHSNNFVYANLFESLTNEATTNGKYDYECSMQNHGLKVKAYRGDNSRFDSNMFQKDYQIAHQKYTYCGVGAHHQNRIIEAINKKITYSARTLLLHAKIFWPKVIKPILWPFVLKASIELHNRIDLNEDGKNHL